jgi:uncharacterized protein YukJ
VYCNPGAANRANGPDFGGQLDIGRPFRSMANGVAHRAGGDRVPIEGYGVLKGRAVRRRIDRDETSPHFHLLIETADARFRAAVNIRSSVDKADLLTCVVDDFQHPVLARLEPLPSGFTRLPSAANSGALDYVRGQLVERRQFRVQPRSRNQSGIADILDLHVARAMRDPSALVYAFGSRWGPKPREIDRTFRGEPIRPSDGVHDIHMNQGNVDRHGRDDDHYVQENGPWQDGALLVHHADEDRWVAFFLAFQSQSWQTDDHTGHPRRDIEPGRAGRVRIVAALINPEGPAPEGETVTLLNVTEHAIDLRGWTLTNADGQRTRLRGSIPARGTRVVLGEPDAPLGNRGGVILLRDADGLKVDGVAYTERQARREGLTVPF